MGKELFRCIVGQGWSAHLAVVEEKTHGGDHTPHTAATVQEREDRAPSDSPGRTQAEGPGAGQVT